MGKQAKFTGYFKLIDAEPTPIQVADNTSFDSMTVGNITGWYSNIVTGSGNRLARYTEYDLMDTDVEVSRALDIVAEEMTNGKDGELLELDIAEETLTDSEQVTINTALERWIRLVGLDVKLFHIARNLVKYGDVLFKRPEPFSKWDYVPPKTINGAYVDQNNAQNVIGFVINKLAKEAQQTPYNYGQKREELIVEPLQKLIRFTLNNDMSDSAPFGKSILSSVYKAYQQKKLIEDSIIIYRVQRAPERRVFYIDVGRMPPQRRKQYLEQIKLEMRQRKVPALNSNDPSSTVDSIYDPQDMMEDFYLATGGEGKGSKIEVLPGGQNLGELKDLEYFSNKLFEGLRIPTNWYRSESPASANDGKVGMAFIQELRFNKFIERLQLQMERTLDEEFKLFVKSIGIRVDPNSYQVKLPEPSNFGGYRQAEMDGTLLNIFSQVTGIPYLSPRFAMKRFLQLTENEMIENERLLREEKDVRATDPQLAMKLYQPEAAESLGSGGGFGSTGAGDFDLGSDEEGDLDAGDDLAPSDAAPDVEDLEQAPDRKI